MKQAKWLLLLAAGIMVMLPGCKQLNPVVNPDASNAAKPGIWQTEQPNAVVYPSASIAGVTPVQWDLMAGQDIDVGYVKVWNDNDFLCIEYKVDVPNWYIEVIHADWETDTLLFPKNKAGNPLPGQFKFQRTFAPAVTDYTIYIPLIWDWNTRLAIATHANLFESIPGRPRIQTQSGWAGDHNWWGNNWAKWFWYTIQEPPSENPNPWDGETRTIGYWGQQHLQRTNLSDPQPYTSDYLPLTLCGITVTTTAQAHAILFPATPPSRWDQFLRQYLSARLDACWNTDLPNAYYNYLGVWSFDNTQVSDIFDEADSYREGTTTDPVLNVMEIVLDNICNYNDPPQACNNCLWDAPWPTPPGY